MKSILIGSVGSSKTVLEEMIKIEFPINMVFSLDEKYSKNVSGYYPLHELAETNNIPYKKFRKINDQENVDLIKEIQPEYIFVIGLSQLIDEDIIKTAKIGAIGYHPAPLPKYRGRAPIVWQILLGVKESKCSLFFIDEGIDSGDIIAQEEYFINDSDYATDVGSKLTLAFKNLLKKTLPDLKEGIAKRTKQDEAEATYLLKRSPEDGEIDWSLPVEKIQRLVRAASKPYPGAFSNYKGKNKVIFWKADYLENKKYIGIPGQIAYINQDFLDIVCTNGLLRVYEYENIDDVSFVVGNKFK